MKNKKDEHVVQFRWLISNIQGNVNNVPGQSHVAHCIKDRKVCR